MAELKALKCTCGCLPEIKLKSHVTGGGRHKGGERTEWWDATCPECCTTILGYPKSEDAAIEKWNKSIKGSITEARVAQEREDADDKLLFDLEHSRNIVNRALGRILRQVEDDDGR